MNKSKLFLPVVYIALSLTFLSCEKLRDYYNVGNDNVEVPNCEVTDTHYQLINPDETYFERRHWLGYNDSGNPTVIGEYTAEYDGHMRYVDEQESPILYDAHNRLIQEGSSIDIRPARHRYVYEGDSPLPVRDSLYLDGDRGVFVEDFEYDAAGRIVRILRRQVHVGGNGTPQADMELRYFYDIRGNRQEHPSNPHYPGVIQYTDKPSIYALHRVWQIMYRDFSRNSTATATTYNEQGLPTNFADSANTYFQPFLGARPGGSVNYLCE